LVLMLPMFSRAFHSFYDSPFYDSLSQKYPYFIIIITFSFYEMKTYKSPDWLKKTSQKKV
jgi:hypothetical protein